MTTEYPWGPIYEAAILETDRVKLARQIEETERALKARLQELNNDHGGTPEERAAISDAMSSLKILKRETEPRNSGSSFSR
jgi:hypothetical protein